MMYLWYYLPWVLWVVVLVWALSRLFAYLDDRRYSEKEDGKRLP